MSVVHRTPTWRVGRKLGRTIYVQVGDAPSDDDVLIGVMDSPALAATAVTCVNVARGPDPRSGLPAMREEAQAKWQEVIVRLQHDVDTHFQLLETQRDHWLDSHLGDVQALLVAAKFRIVDPDGDGS